MSLPHRLTSTGAGYVVSYLTPEGQEAVRFEVEDIESARWGMNATMVVRSRIEGSRTLDGQFVTMARIALLSPQSRSGLARDIEKRIRRPSGAAPMDMELMVDEVCQEVIEATKAPLLVTDLSTIKPASTPRFLVPNIVQEDESTILYAAGGSGKSYLALAIAAAVQVGGQFLGRDCERREVLYLDWESKPEQMARRLMLVSRGLGLTSLPPVKYINLIEGFRRHQAGIAQAVAEHGIGFVIIDSVSMATAGEGTGSVTSDAIAFMRGLRALGVTCLLIDHISSDDVKRGKPVNKAMGAVAKGNQARAAFELRDTTEPGSQHHITLRHTKVNDTRRFPDLQMFVDWIGPTEDEIDRVMFREDKGWVEPEVKPLDIRIIDLLGTAPATPKQLQEMLDGATEFDIRRTIADLKKDGMVAVDPTTGMTRLTTQEAPTIEQPALDLGD
jgi:hypothetical protein